MRAYLEIGEIDRQYLLVLYWLGFERTVVDVPTHDRYAGTSAYSTLDLVRVALDFQTPLLLRLMVLGGLAVAGIRLLLAVAIVVLHFVPRGPAGWASLATPTLVLGGMIRLIAVLSG